MHLYSLSQAKEERTSSDKQSRSEGGQLQHEALFGLEENTLEFPESERSSIGERQYGVRVGRRSLVSHTYMFPITSNSEAYYSLARYVWRE